MKNSELNSKERYEQTEQLMREIESRYPGFKPQSKIKTIHLILFLLVLVFAMVGESLFNLILK